MQLAVERWLWNTGCRYHLKKVILVNAVIFKSNSIMGNENIHS